jgi:hypothetical protein
MFSFSSESTLLRQIRADDVEFTQQLAGMEAGECSVSGEDCG